MKSNLVKGMAATALTGGALALGTGMANAAPVKPAHPAPTNPYRVTAGIAPGVTYTGDSQTGAAQFDTPWGTLKSSQGRFGVADPSGKTVFGDPRVQGPKPATEVPAALRGPANPLRPGMAAAATPAEGAPQPKKMTQSEKTAAIESSISKVSTNFGFAYAIGAMVGGVGGLVVGCPVGAVTLGLASAATVVGTAVSPAAAALGCLVGAATFGGTGAIIGGAVVSVPVGVVSGIQQYDYLQAIGALS